MAPERTSLVVSPDQLTRFFLVSVALLVCASTAGQVTKYFLGHDHLFGLTRLTYLNGEATIPAWFSSMALLMAAGVLAVIGTVKRRAGDGSGWYWTTLALGFVYMSVDEAAAIHELWGEPIEARFAPSGYLSFAWVIPALALIAVVGVLYTRFLWSLPTVTRRLFVAAGALFVGSAVGVEMLGANYVATHGTGNFTYSMLVTLEESGEMLGIILFLYAVLRYLAVECGVIRVEVMLPDAVTAPSLQPVPLTAADLTVPERVPPQIAA